jgi:hypothetical protein
MWSTTETAVIVPTMRPGNAQSFMSSLRASTDHATVYAVTDEVGAQAWHAAGADVIVDEAVTFAQRVNVGYRQTDEPWLFLVGDDVKFWPGWLTCAQLVASRRWHVVGTNDRCNPRVVAGEHATHLLVRRSYVDEVGASWDGPKMVTHEGYHHWFVDDEVVVAAKQRGVWAMARSSVVEHLHPMTGRHDWDAVYEASDAHAGADRELFLERLARYAG